MVSLVEALGGLGINARGGGAVAPASFAPVGTVARSIRGGNVAALPGAPPIPQSSPVSAAAQQLATQTIVAGDVGDQEPGVLGLSPTTRDSTLLGLAAGLEAGGIEGGAFGALRGFVQGKAIERGRPTREAAAKTAKEKAKLEAEKTESEIEKNLRAGIPDVVLTIDDINAIEDPVERRKKFDDILELTRSRAARTTTAAGETELAKQRSKQRAERESAVIEPVQLAAATANSKIRDLQKLQIAAPQVISGPFAEGRANMARVAGWLGAGDISKRLIGDLPSAELMQAANTNLSIQALQAFSGATSDFELRTIQSSFPRMASSEAGNQLLAELGIRAEQNKIALNNELDEYLNEFGGSLRPPGEESWNTRRNRFFEENPLLTPAIKAQLQVVRDKGFRSPEQEERINATIGAIDNGTLSGITATNFPINSEDINMLSFNDLGTIVNNTEYWNTLSPEVHVIIANEIARRTEEFR